MDEHFAEINGGLGWSILLLIASLVVLYKKGNRLQQSSN